MFNKNSNMLVDVVRCPIYPSKSQQDILFEHFKICTEIRNILLDRKNFNSNQLPILKMEHPEYKKVYARVLVNLSNELIYNVRCLTSLKRKGKKIGYMRHKLVRHLIYNEHGYKLFDDKIFFSKIGEIPIIYTKEIRGEIKQISIKFTKTNKWFVSILTRIPKPENICLCEENVIGIDLNLENFSTDSDGFRVEHPNNLKKALRKLKRAQKSLSRKRKGSKNREKAKLKLSIVNEVVANRRDDFLHKWSNDYVNKKGYTGIAVEKLNTMDMLRRNKKKYSAVNRKIADSSWFTARSYLKYKAERAGITYREVDPSYTSQTCSSCGYKQKMPLYKREFRCPVCGVSINRDINAAINIKDRAFCVGGVPTEFKTDEICITAYKV
jgi:putative transposase